MNDIIDWTTKYPILNWMGYNWCQDMPGGDKMHPDIPYRLRPGAVGQHY
jgi:hypothetical protein